MPIKTRKYFPVAVIDTETPARNKAQAKIVDRFKTVRAAEKFIELLGTKGSEHRAKVERGAYSIDAPEEIINPGPKPGAFARELKARAMSGRAVKQSGLQRADAARPGEYMSLQGDGYKIVRRYPNNTVALRCPFTGDLELWRFNKTSKAPFHLSYKNTALEFVETLESNQKNEHDEITYEVRCYRSEEDFDDGCFIVAGDGIISKASAMKMANEMLNAYAVVKVRSFDGEFDHEMRRAKAAAPTHSIEDETQILPYIIADGVCHEVSYYFGESVNYTKALVERAERVYAANHDKQFGRKLRGRHGRDYLAGFMRHWLAAILKEYHADLFRRLPGGFCIGQPIPPNVRAEPPMGAISITAKRTKG